MALVNQLKPLFINAIAALYNHHFTTADITINNTKPEFEGDYTLVLFSFIKVLKQSPDQLGKEIGAYMLQQHPELFKNYNLIKGFLNFTISDAYFLNVLEAGHNDPGFGIQENRGKKVVVEYSSPNTNKPLHLGHLRNNFLGWSIAEILKATGHDTVKTSIINDRGIHICKSMIAWQQFANGETPADTGTKGDHFVGAYYVKFNEAYKQQVSDLVATGQSKEEAEKNAPILKATQQMLLDWENSEAGVMELWEKMNTWVYQGFDVTYKRIGCDFDKTYYESQTYLLGKHFVKEGLSSGVLYKKEDGSVWIDLTNEGLDEKLVLRKDGTSVYITQDLGLAQQKYEDYQYDESIYVIGDEQNYHMKVLKLIMQKLQAPYADGIHHLSYGMVELPSGRMKSREGTVVDADDLVDEMVTIAAQHTEASGKVQDFTQEELKELYETIGLGALKFYLLRVDPKKRMIFNPEESIDFHGFTGPFVQYTHARIKSILRKQMPDDDFDLQAQELLAEEKELLLQLDQYPVILNQASDELNPSVVAIYVFNVAKTFNSFYTNLSVMNAESEDKKQLRLKLCRMTAHVIKSAMQKLGINVPERM